MCDASTGSQPCFGATGVQALNTLHSTFRVLHPGINVGAEAGYLIAIAVFFKLAHAILFTVLTKEAKVVLLPAVARN